MSDNATDKYYKNHNYHTRKPVYISEDDQRRGKDFRATFPQLAEWYDTL